MCKEFLQIINNKNECLNRKLNKEHYELQKNETQVRSKICWIQQSRKCKFINSMIKYKWFFIGENLQAI